jgi:hypothetical protein
LVIGTLRHNTNKDNITGRQNEMERLGDFTTKPKGALIEEVRIIKDMDEKAHMSRTFVVHTKRLLTLDSESASDIT